MAMNMAGMPHSSAPESIRASWVIGRVVEHRHRLAHGVGIEPTGAAGPEAPRTAIRRGKLDDREGDWGGRHRGRTLEPDDDAADPGGALHEPAGAPHTEHPATDAEQAGPHDHSKARQANEQLQSAPPCGASETLDSRAAVSAMTRVGMRKGRPPDLPLAPQCWSVGHAG